MHSPTHFNGFVESVSCLEGERMLALSTEKVDSPKGLMSNLLGLKAGVKGAQDDKFSLLLKSFSFGKTDAKEFLFANDEGIEEKPLSKLNSLLQLGEEPKETTKKGTNLAALFSLGKETASDEEQLHPDILKALPQKELKQNIQTLIGEAKSYLKEQISQKTDIKELPKTLGGLIRLAEKSGIDIKSIKLDSLPKTTFTQELVQAKTALPVSLSTSQIVKPIPVKTEKEAVQKPLNALLTKTNEISTPSIPVVEVLEEEVIQPNKQLNASIASLLHGNNSDESVEEELTHRIEGSKEHDKPQHVNQAKTEALSQKITEAKQLVQHVAQNVKESIENYKPPFTRIKMQLNPQKFGDMEVTLVQRGNNVHININANTNALSVMMQNSHELKAQLSAQGLNDTQMNFSSQQQQQEQRKQEQATLAYEDYQDFDEEFTEVATALEIVVPRYI